MGYYHCSSSHGDEYGVLQQCLKDILSSIKPSSDDESKRFRALLELTAVVLTMESLKGVPVEVRPFGSYLSVLYTKWGDLDISVELTNHSFISTGRHRQIKVLRDIMNKLLMMGLTNNMDFIPRARVPVLRYENKDGNVSCDVSIDNHLGWMKSRVLFLISGIDQRFRDLVLLIKEWANAHDINDPKSGTLNSYSLCLLVIFHFQTCEPAILPPLKDIYERNFGDLEGPMRSIEREIEDTCVDNIAKFNSSKQRNGNNLAQLLIHFFDKFSTIVSSDFAICTYTGRWERRISNWRWMEKPHSLIIEDPFDRPDNAARTVGSQGLHRISKTVEKTFRKLSESSVLSSRNALLANLVRPSVRLELEETVGFSGVITHRYI